MRRRNPRAAAALILAGAGGVLSIPVIHYLQGRDSGFLYPLGFESGITGSPLAWALGLLVSGAYVAFSVRNIPAVA